MADQETASTSFKMEVVADFDIDARDIVAKLNRQQVFQLIKELDEEAGSWELTCLIADHFNREAGRARSEDLVTPKVALMTTSELEQYITDLDVRDASAQEVA